MNHADSKSPPSLLAATLSGAMPIICKPEGTAVRRHRLDDASLHGRKKEMPVHQPESANRGHHEFNAADRELIRRVHGYMSAGQLLGVLNTRLVCDKGEGAVRYTLDQLKAEIDSMTTAVPACGNDWGALRKLLAKARREGVLDQINEQVINDFAVVFSLNQKQVMSLKDVLLSGDSE